MPQEDSNQEPCDPQPNAPHGSNTEEEMDVDDNDTAS